ncbi:MAG: hypothetical protein ACJARD_001098 [Alphaproteobacteria bacterium]|jgi:hypothetical protein
MIKKIMVVLCLFLIQNFAYAGVDLKNTIKINENSKLMMQQFKFFASPFTKPDLSPLETYCNLPEESAKKYLKNKFKSAQSNYIAAYHYGILIGFAPCIDKKPQQSLRYLMKASRNGITKSSYLVGLLLLKENNLKNAQNYFKQGAQALHPQSAYNYALIASKNLTILDDNIIKYLEIAASDGENFVRHDTAIAQLKHHLTHQKYLKKSEIIRIKGILTDTMVQSNNNRLKILSKNNLAIIKSLESTINNKQTTKYNQPIYYSSVDIDNINKSKDNQYKKLFNSLEKQGLKTFDEYMNSH